ncbi:MAG: hypoxanthine phosphoribosyltransferase [Anaerolineales bacterium]|nr:MAG: hypoxanthine phosphoribosyltransferase [Anaerolineales bacterium]
MKLDIDSIVISEAEIQERIKELGKRISFDYQGKNPLFIGVLKGVLFFLADLLRCVTIPLEVDFLAVSSYSAEARNKGVVRLVKDLDIPIDGRHVVFVEDVVDTGLTLNYILQNLKMRQPASIKVCTLFDKRKHRLITLPLEYVGFELPDRFVVGYGLDFREKYRNLPFIGLLKSSVLTRETSPE